MQISSHNSIHVWLEIYQNKYFGNISYFCVYIFLKIKTQLIWLNGIFQLEAALRRQKGLVGMESFGTALPVSMYFQTCQDSVNAYM